MTVQLDYHQRHPEYHQRYLYYSLRTVEMNIKHIFCRNTSHSPSGLWPPPHQLWVYLKSELSDHGSSFKASSGSSSLKWFIDGSRVYAIPQFAAQIICRCERKTWMKPQESILKTVNMHNNNNHQLVAHGPFPLSVGGPLMFSCTRSLKWTHCWINTANKLHLHYKANHFQQTVDIYQ